jgi:hypothetical protein
MMTSTEVATANGVRVARFELSRVFSAAEAAETDRDLNGKFRGCKMLVVMQPGTEVPAETREVMSKMDRTAMEGAAVVVPSPPLRIFALFIFRVLGLKTATVHPDEATAMAALDSRR